MTGDDCEAFMSGAITFVVPGQPIGKGRPRIGRIGPHARMFTPERTANYEAEVRLYASQAMGGMEPIADPVRTTLQIAMQIPASWSRKAQQRAEEGIESPCTKPDIDNVIKTVFDGMNGIVWRDDVQVVQLAVRKHYSRTPGVTVSVEPLV